MLIIGDLQADDKQPHRQAVLNLFDWLYENYPDEIYVQVGDFHDSSAIANDVREELTAKAKKFKEFHILTGNHDKNSNRKNALLPMRQHDNIFIYDDIAEVKIDGFKCLMIPYQRSIEKVKEYEKYNFDGDIIFSHFFHPKKSFNGIEAIDLSNMKAKYYIYGHDHTYAQIDNHYIIGCVIPASQGQINNPLIKIDTIESKLEFIEHPEYFIYEDVEYGEQPKNKNNILNIKNAPSIDSVYDTYKDCYIRDEGITFKQNDIVNINDISFDMSNISNQFLEFTKQSDMSGLSEDVKNTCLKYLA